MGFILHFQISNVMKLLKFNYRGALHAMMIGEEFLVFNNPILSAEWVHNSKIYINKSYGFRIKKINNGGGVKEILRD